MQTTKSDSILHESCYCNGGWTFYVVLTRTHLVVGKAPRTKPEKIFAAIREAVESRTEIAQAIEQFSGLGHKPVSIPLELLKSIEWTKSGKKADAIVSFSSLQTPDKVKKYSALFPNQDERKSFVDSLKSSAAAHNHFEGQTSFWDPRFCIPGLLLAVAGLVFCMGFAAEKPSVTYGGVRGQISDLLYAIGPTGRLIVGLIMIPASIAGWLLGVHFLGVTDGVTFQFESESTSGSKSESISGPESEPESDLRKWYQRVCKGPADLYSFLDLRQFESDVELIKKHARQRIRFADTWVRQHSSDARADKLVGSIKAAATKLLKPELKMAYDQKLKQKQRTSDN